jgi:hypothetical protein
MRRQAPWIAGLCAVLLGSGCGPAESVNPLSDPAAAKLDERLAGTWLAADEEGEEDQGTLSFTALDGARMKVVLAEKGDDEPLELEMFPTTLDGRTYMNLKSASPKAELGRNYIIARYEISGDATLSLKLLSDEFLKQAVAEGRLKGTVSGSSDEPPVLVTESTEKLAEFVRSSDPARLFGDEARFRKAGTR